MELNPDITKKNIPKIKWHQSIITPVSLSLFLILLVGISATVFLEIKNIKNLSEIVHDEEIDHTLSNYLEHIKQNYKLKQELLKLRLQTYFIQKSDQNIILSKTSIRTILNELCADLYPEIDEIDISQLDSEVSKISKDNKIFWIKKDRLQIDNFMIRLEKEQLFNSFEEVNSIRQRYQLLGATLGEQILPAIIKSNLLVILISLLLFAIVIFIYGSRINQYLDEIVQGFTHWRYDQLSFRFSKNFPGELGIITKQFNNMAKQVEDSHKKSVNLEKIASWQVIAKKLAHEIKNPLTPIKMMVSQLPSAYKGDDQKFATLLNNAQIIITEEVNRLRNLVDHFSNFAKLPLPVLKNTDIKPIVEEIVIMEQAAFPQHQINLICNLDEVYAYVDGEQIKQIVLNLVKNAAEANEKDHSSIQVIIKKSETELFLDIEDNGPGIPFDIQSKIFEAYFTTKHTGMSTGMGLGLAICQKIVIDHNGEIALKSRPGKTVFHITLPNSPHYREEHINDRE